MIGEKGRRILFCAIFTMTTQQDEADNERRKGENIGYRSTGTRPYFAYFHQPNTRDYKRSTILPTLFALSPRNTLSLTLMNSSHLKCYDMLLFSDTKISILNLKEMEDIRDKNSK